MISSHAGGNLTPYVLYEDKNFLAIDKPAGLLVHDIKNQKLKIKNRTVVDWLRRYYPEVEGVGDEPKLRPGIVHRIDKDTSGVMLVAKTQKYFDYLKSLFMEHRIKKTYRALVWGRPKEERGTIALPIGIKSGTTKRSVHSEKMQKEALTEYRVIKTWMQGEENVSLVELSPKTGRTHQLRVHLAAIGCPIVGDPIYSRRTAPWITRLMLHAFAIEFEASPRHVLRIEAEPPALLSYPHPF